MKTLLIILATAGIAFGSAFFVISNQQAARAQQRVATAKAEWEREKTELENALAQSQGRPVQNVTVARATPAKNTRMTPKEIIEKLAATRPGTSAERARNLRLVIFYMESLAEWQQEALPDIKDFLARNEDVDYTVLDEPAEQTPADANQNQSGQNGRGAGRQRGGGRNDIFQLRRGGEIRTDFIFPPSLRLGLVDVLRAIGGAEAEKILAGMLGTTGRGIEVAYIVRVLEQISPGKYRDLAITVAKDLLTNPPAVDGNSRLDENAKGYLYGVLALYNDTSFAANAQALLVTAEGRIDQSALNYLNSALKEMAVPTLYAAYNNPALTNFWDKARLGESILNYAGNNQTANQLFTQVLNDPNMDDRMKMAAIIRLAGGGFGPFQTESPTDPAVIKARINLVQNSLTSTTSESVGRALGLTLTNLTTLANGGTIENNGMRDLFFGGRGGGNNGNNRRGNRGGTTGAVPAGGTGN